jgi:hypothetical protein
MTLRIRLKVNVYGDWNAVAGEEVERPEPEARDLIKCGLAVLVEAPAPKEEQ